MLLTGLLTEVDTKMGEPSMREAGARDRRNPRNPSHGIKVKSSGLHIMYGEML
jgi:hypothetical protein